MKVILTGGTGLIGSHLADSLARDGHEVIVLSRSPEAKRDRTSAAVKTVGWDAKTADGWGKLADGADAIVNLAGKNLATWPWSEKNKRAFWQSRVNAGNAVVEAVERAQNKPRLVIQASATDYYGERGAEMMVESDPPGDDFLARLCAAWETSTAAVEGLGVRRVIIRTGLPFTMEGGVFPKLVLPVRLFAGGPLGSGDQYYPWLHLYDEIRAIRFLIDNPELEGPFNLSAPTPARQREVTATIAKILGRPAFLPAPAFAMRLVLGEMATVVLDSNRMVPTRLQEAGFEFKFPELEPALRDILKGDSGHVKVGSGNALSA